MKKKIEELLIKRGNRKGNGSLPVSTKQGAIMFFLFFQFDQEEITMEKSVTR
jgi:hypothetical protein